MQFYRCGNQDLIHGNFKKFAQRLLIFYLFMQQPANRPRQRICGLFLQTVEKVIVSVYNKSGEEIEKAGFVRIDYDGRKKR